MSATFIKSIDLALLVTFNKTDNESGATVGSDCGAGPDLPLRYAGRWAGGGQTTAENHGVSHIHGQYHHLGKVLMSFTEGVSKFSSFYTKSVSLQ